MSQLFTLGGVLLLGLAFVVAGVVAVNLPASWVGLIYVGALLVLGIAGIRKGAKLRREGERGAKNDAF
jgi:hypothetical protein